MIKQVNLEEECQSQAQWEKGRESVKFSEVKKSGESVTATRVKLRARGAVGGLKAFSKTRGVST